MVLYFSGTGNSKHVAECMQDPRIVDISEALNKRKCGFTLKEDEPVGFVCPVYYSGVPKTVLEFVRHMKLKGTVTYIYSILTHGGGFGGSGWMLKHELEKKGYHMDACFDVKMASNYIMLGPLKDVETEKQQLKDAELRIEELRQKVEGRICELPDWSDRDIFLTRSMYLLCDRYMSTKKFYSDERCTGCGLCAKRCPSHCIEMVDGRPSWTKNKNKCVRCMACFQCNAVQYGEKTRDRRRYRYKKAVCDQGLASE